MYESEPSSESFQYEFKRRNIGDQISSIEIMPDQALSGILKVDNLTGKINLRPDAVARPWLYPQTGLYDVKVIYRSDNGEEITEIWKL